MTVQPTDRHPTASIVTLDPTTGRVLLVWHKYYQCYVFPGGHQEPNETLAETALRELREETATEAFIVFQSQVTPRLPADMTRVSTPWLTFTIPAPAKPDRPGKPAEPAHTHIDSLFIGIADSGKPLMFPPDEVDAAIWAAIDDLGQLSVRADVRGLTWRAWLLVQNEPVPWARR